MKILLAARTEDESVMSICGIGANLPQASIKAMNLGNFYAIIVELNDFVQVNQQQYHFIQGLKNIERGGI